MIMAALSVFRSQSFLPRLFPTQKRISAQAGLRAIRCKDFVIYIIFNLSISIK